MDREQMEAFVQDLAFPPTVLDQLVYGSPKPEPLEDTLGRWVRTAQPEWLPLAVSLIHDYPDRFSRDEHLRGNWDYTLKVMFERWARFHPDLVLHEMARLMEDPERRETALFVFGLADPPLSQYLRPWVSRTAELSDDHLTRLIEALGDNPDPATNRLLLDMQPDIRVDRAEPRERLDFFIRKRGLVEPRGDS